jgi:nucleolar protein 15
MDNYLLAGHILRVKLVPREHVHPQLWVGANRKWRVVPRARVARVQHNKVCALGGGFERLLTRAA